MKRSKINERLRWSQNLLDKNGFKLPMFGYWELPDWKKNRADSSIIQHMMLGWDITDFGRGDFERIGAILFTIRNGDIKDSSIGTPYAEKLILLHDGQTLPLHFHFLKTEDIINRGGGVLVLQLFNSKQDKSVDEQSDVTVYCDGIKRTFAAGERIEIFPGDSITLRPFMYHLFIAKKGSGDLIVGEVSAINDDNADNYFTEDSTRFSTIEEDEPILHPLCNEYDLFI